MWFKNLIFYRFSQPFSLSDEALTEKLQPRAFQLCGAMDNFSYGWSSPLGANRDGLTFTASQCTMICARREEKVLPSSVVKEFVDAKVEELEEQQMRKLRKKERDEIRDEVMLDLMPRAFTRSIYTFAYIDRQNGLLIVDSSSHKRAEDLTTLLRKCLGSLPIEMPMVNHTPTVAMTSWISEGNIPADLIAQDECELRSPDENGAVIRCKSQDLDSDEIQGHLAAEKQITKLAVTWDDRLSFVLSEDLTIKRIKFTDLVQDQIDDCNAESYEEKFDADFTVMCLEYSRLFQRLFEFFGGEQVTEKSAVA